MDGLLKLHERQQSILIVMIFCIIIIHVYSMGVDNNIINWR